MKTVVIATNNKHKLKEFRELLKDYNILSLKEIGFDEEIEENGTTFEENSTIKIKAVLKYLNDVKKQFDMIIADDSGLCVPSLNGAPGVYSARYSGEHGNDQANRDKLLKELEGKDRQAYFVCSIVLYDVNGQYHTFEGKTYGEILKEERGSKEFGYDCIFYSNDLKKTFGEAAEEEKNEVSHRGRAIKNLLDSLK